MKKDALKWLLLGGALVLILLYGIEMSSSGIERINGPMNGGFESMNSREDTLQQQLPTSDKTLYSDAAAELQELRIAKLEQELEELRELALSERLPGLPAEAEEASVNKLADSASGALQSASSNGIKFVVSLFDGLTK